MRVSVSTKCYCCGLDRSVLTITDRVETPLFTSDDDVGHSLSLLPSLRRKLQPPIPVKHLQETIRRIPVLSSK